MTNKGVPDTIVDFWLGHEIGEMAEAYKRTRFEELRRIYLEKEVFISLTTGGELEKKLRAELDEKSKQLQSLVNGLANENLGLRNEVRDLQEKTKQLEECMARYEDFTQRFIEMSPDELEELGRAIKERKMQKIK